MDRLLKSPEQNCMMTEIFKTATLKVRARNKDCSNQNSLREDLNEVDFEHKVVMFHTYGTSGAIIVVVRPNIDSVQGYLLIGAAPEFVTKLWVSGVFRCLLIDKKE